MNKVGQISSPNKGSYDQEAYPTEEDFINEWEAIKADFESIDEDIFILEEQWPGIIRLDFGTNMIF